MVQTSIASWLRKRSSVRPSAASSGTLAQPVELSRIEADRPVQDVQPSVSTVSENNNHSALPELSADGSRVETRTNLLPDHVEVVPISESNINNFRRLVTLLLPIPYPDAFFKETIEDPVIASISRAALWHAEQGLTTASDAKPQLVAAIRCRLLASVPGNPEDRTPVLYISTITTLAPFRGHALATALLEEVTLTAFQDYGVSTVMAHVWEANEDAIIWYKKRGFEVVDRLEGYYRRLAPHTAALIVRKDLGHQEYLAALGGPAFGS